MAKEAEKKKEAKKPKKTMFYRADRKTLTIQKIVVDVNTPEGKAYMAEKKTEEGWTDDLAKAKERLETFKQEAEYSNKEKDARYFYEVCDLYMAWYDKTHKTKGKLHKYQKEAAEKEVAEIIKKYEVK